jgi:precorrin-8X/cobalt-precorrin-8 methylmutase
MQESSMIKSEQNKIEWDGKKIEKTSHDLIDDYLDRMGSWFSDPDIRAIVRRVIHSTADFSFADTLRISADAIESGIQALQNQAPIICDVKMTAAGCTHGDKNIICEISNPAVIELAAAKKITRAGASMELLGTKLNGAIVIVGNAPTALWKIMEIWNRESGPRPALVIGLPVGFVGAYESKQMLSLSGIPCITNLSPRGGSPVAAASFNALVELSKTRTAKE